MKKLIIILIAAISFNAASAQSWNDGNHTQDRRQVMQNDSRNYNDQRQSNDYAYNNNNQWKDDHGRQAGDGHMKQQYDQRADGYRNDRSFSRYERGRKIWGAEQGREQRPRPFGNGAIIGGVAGFLLGVLVSH